MGTENYLPGFPYLGTPTAASSSGWRDVSHQHADATHHHSEDGHSEKGHSEKGQLGTSGPASGHGRHRR